MRAEGGRLRGLAGAAVRFAIAALFLAPFAWVVLASFRAPGSLPPTAFAWIPDPLSLDAWSRLLTEVPTARQLLASCLVAGIAVPAATIIASLAGFAIAQLGGSAQRTFVALAVVLLLVPAPALWLTRFLLFRVIGIVDTPVALILPAVAGVSPLLVLLATWGFRRIPRGTIESARLDGASPFRAWRSVALPLVAPTTLAMAVLAFVATWGDAISPLLYLRTDAWTTLPLGLRALQVLDRTDWPILLAGAVLLALPAVLVFGLAQRRFLGDDRLAGLIRG